jgi:hypothetical protein
MRRLMIVAVFLLIPARFNSHTDDCASANVPVARQHHRGLNSCVSGEAHHNMAENADAGRRTTGHLGGCVRPHDVIFATLRISSQPIFAVPHNGGSK